ARRSDRLHETDATVQALDGLELESGRHARALEAITRDLPVGEEALRVHDAAHLQAVHALGLLADAQNALGAPAADVDHQAAPIERGQVVRDAAIQNARFFTPRQHVDVVPQ